MESVYLRLLRDWFISDCWRYKFWDVWFDTLETEIHINFGLSSIRLDIGRGWSLSGSCLSGIGYFGVGKLRRSCVTSVCAREPLGLAVTAVGCLLLVLHIYNLKIYY